MRKNATGKIRIWSRRLLLALLGLLVLAALALWLFLRGSLAQLDGTRAAPGLHGDVSVTRDALGVPLISGGNRLDVAYASGFVQAQERYFQMDLLRRVGAGELAELFGPRALGLDKSRRPHRFRARAERAVLALPAEQRRFLERYVGGVNDGLAALSTRPFEYALIGVKPRPWTAADSLLVVWAMYFDLQGGLEPRELARGWLREHSSVEQRAFLLPESTQWDAPLDAERVPPPSAPIPAAPPLWWGRPPALDAPKLAGAEMLDAVGANAVGSNNWALAGSRSQDGAAIIADDMHLNIQLPNTWYRVALQFPDARGGQRRMVGVMLPGAPPLLAVGSNGHVAWSFTNSYGDYLDLVELGRDPAQPGQVRTPAGWERPAAYQETILIKGAPAQQLLVRESSLGPLREVAGRLYAVHWVAHAAEAVNLNPALLESADSMADALAVAAAMGVPAQNFVAGDDQGNIGWTIAGPLPRRVQPGPASSFPLALDGAAASWQGWLTPAEYPRVSNPADGQLSTANSRQLMGAGAELLGDGGFDLGARGRQVRDGLSALGAKTDVRGAYGVGLDDRAIFLSGWRERAIAALDAGALEKRPQRAEFLALLKNGWSGRASVDSVGYRLTRAFMWALHDLVFEGANAELAKLDGKANVALATSRWPVVLARLLDARPAGWLPLGHASWQALQLAAVDRVIADLGKGGKPLSAATWGERNTASIAHPISAAVPWLRRWLAVPPDMLPGDNHMPRVAGSTFGQSERLTVSPGREEQGVFNMPGGQSGHPLSPFFLAGHADWVAGRTTPLLPGPAQHTLTLSR
ncbi:MULTISPECIES: penicillin acylase family protein [unclassified Janthinobacterium]|uniref:penicillin acylase family protein n=1 Tax=unclassified Janthinobacterium TaxID=2610881 RepID=UPI00036D97AD|nr:MULTISPECIES: penicillin acylase family protein [unclassified Janthinobacterium]MEC5162085.1 penicillin amidase [Janthinobacterium sp. CG_S6]